MAACGFTFGRGDFDVPCKQEGNPSCEGKCWQHCSVGRAYNARLIALHSKRLTEYQINQHFYDIMDEWIEHAVQKHSMPDTREKKTRNGKYNGPFAFTLTMSPSDGLTEEDMIFACKKVMEQKSQPVKKFAWYLEYKDVDTKRHPHIHGMYETDNGRRIEAKHWKRSWKIWDEHQKLGVGHRGGYHRPIYHDEAYSSYIAKQQGVGESHGV